MRQYFAKLLLLIVLLFGITSNRTSGTTFLGIGGFSDEAFNAAIVTLLGSIESLNSIANSNVIKGLMETKKLVESAGKIKETADFVLKKYKQGKLVLAASLEMINTFNAYLQLIKDIYKHTDLLMMEEIEVIVTMIDYTVFNQRSFDNSLSVDSLGNRISGKKGIADLGGVLASRLESMKTLLLNFSKNENVTSIQTAEKEINEMFQQLKKIRYDVELIKKYAKSTLLYKRYLNGYYNTKEFRQYVYHSKYRALTEFENKARENSIIKIFK